MHYKDIFQELTRTVQNILDENAPHPDAHYMQTCARKQAVYQAEKNLKFIAAIQVKLPQSLEFFTLPSNYIDKATTQTLRQIFKDSAKSDYIAHLAKAPKNRQAFIDMGLSAEDIKTLSTRGLTRDVKHGGKQLDMVVDHIQDLSLGGKNDPSNFTLIPDYINQIKAQLIHMQERIIPDSPICVSIKPTNGAPIPYIPPGFRPMTSGSKLCQQINSFLGLDP